MHEHGALPYMLPYLQGPSATLRASEGCWQAGTHDSPLGTESLTSLGLARPESHAGTNAETGMDGSQVSLTVPHCFLGSKRGLSDEITSVAAIPNSRPYTRGESFRICCSYSVVGEIFCKQVLCRGQGRLRLRESFLPHELRTYMYSNY